MENRSFIVHCAKPRGTFWLLLAALFVFSDVHATEPIAPTGYDYESCNWLVTYRNRTYDLSPLTREGLARPVEGDLRLILSRVPEANAHLNNVTKKVHEAKFHSLIGTASIMMLVGTRIARSNAQAKGRSDNTKLSLDVASLISGLFFLKATYDSERATQATRTELLEAVNAFNTRSPHKIEPTQTGGP